jgi:hypothetical protein
MARDVEIINEKGESEFVGRDFARELVANGYGAWPNSREGRRRTGRSGGSGRVRNAALQAGAAIIGVTGYVANPGQPPNTDQLADAHATQQERNRDAIGDKSNEQGTETGQQ